ncbi:gephyrin-like molybdotransferase Glp [Paraferrimonas sp. SM1919]|uniref:molybdopterin molybdotransferase MoeA n=1 Tax=Paraferrimonas sp. SM1919 TaxID=2662263 RepID=UPI0013CF6FA2|nr:gephyrin-like molybdotransferase Glp [Paraferrimonas sp. SM1919]
MISYPQALEIINQAQPLQSMAVPIGAAQAYVSAKDIKSSVNVPPFANSAMDGFAVVSSELANASEQAPVIMKVAGDSVAGDAPSAGLGQAWEIMTGAPVPSGYDAVVKVEDVEVLERQANGYPAVVSFSASVPAFNNIRLAGEDIHQGDILIAKGDIIEAPHIMALAAIGKATVEVTRPPEVALIATGTELQDDPTKELLPGQIRNSNTPYLQQCCAELGIDADYVGAFADDPELFEDSLSSLIESQDIIISTGAVSAGRHDFIPDSLRKLGAIIEYHKVQIRPGKPILYARFENGCHYFGLPGNPISSVVGFRFFVYPLIRTLQGLPVEQPIMAKLAKPFNKKHKFRFFAKGLMSVDSQGQLQAEILPGQESFKIQPLLKANCWVVLDEPAKQYEQQIVTVYPLSPVQLTL